MVKCSPENLSSRWSQYQGRTTIKPFGGCKYNILVPLPLAALISFASFFSDEIPCTTNDPCRNGGTCSGTVLNYQCSCPDGYEGISCESKWWLNSNSRFIKLLFQYTHAQYNLKCILLNSIRGISLFTTMGTYVNENLWWIKWNVSQRKESLRAKFRN